MGVYCVGLADPLQDSQPVHVGQHDVEDQYVGVDLFELGYRLAPVVGDFDGPALVVQGHLHQIGQRRLVVDQQNPDRRTIGAVYPGQLPENGLAWPLATRVSRHCGHIPDSFNRT